METIQWTDAGVVMIDQSRLPREQEFVTCRTYQEVADAIKTMVIRGAPAIGVAAAMGVALGVQEGADFETVCKTLAATRPTAVNLFWGIERMRKLYDAAARCIRARKSSAAWFEEAQQIRLEDIAICQAIGRHGERAGARRQDRADALQRGRARDGGIRHGAGRDPRRRRAPARRSTSSPTKPGRSCKARGSPPGSCSRTGSRPPSSPTTWPDIFCARDGSAAWWSAPTASPPMATWPTRSGPIRVAVLAKENGVPFYVAAPVSTFDLTLASGDQIPIEQRSARRGHARLRSARRARVDRRRESGVRCHSLALCDRHHLRTRRGPRALRRIAARTLALKPRSMLG